MIESNLDRVDRRRLIMCPIMGGAAILTMGLTARAATDTGQATPLLAQDRSADVPMFRGNPAHTGVMPGPGPDAWNGVEVIWWLETTDTAISPAIADGVLYTGPTLLKAEPTGDWEAQLLAIDAYDGSEIWHFNALSLHSTPAVVDGVVYVVRRSELDPGNLIAVDANEGTELWHYGRPGHAFSSPTVVGDVVFVGDLWGHLYAVSAKDGAELWQFDSGVKHAFSSPSVSDGGLFAACNDGNLYALDGNEGTERWRFRVGEEIVEYYNDGYFNMTPAVADGLVYVVSDTGILYAIDAKDGTERWHFVDAAFSSPAVADGVVFVSSKNGYLYALDAKDGSEIWQFATGWGVASSPTLADGVVYVWMHDLYAIDAKRGTERWRLSGDDGSAPLVVANGMVFAGRGGRMLAIGARLPELSIGGTARLKENTILRGGPTATAVVRAELAPDTVVTITDESVTTDEVVWWPVTVDATGDQGWVEASTLEPLSSGPQ